MATFETGFDVAIYRLTGATCTESSDVVSVTGGTCTLIGYMNTANYSASTEMIDSTAFGDTIRKKKPGFSEHSYSLSGTLAPTNTAQEAMRTASLNRSLENLRFKHTDSKMVRHGHGYISNYSESASVGDKVSCSFDFSFTSKPKTCTYA